MVRFLAAPFVCLLAVLPVITLAGEFEYLVNDLDILEEEMANDAVDEQQQAEDLDYEEEEELFPRQEDMPVEPEQDLSDVSDTHVAVLVDGTPVVLDDVPNTTWFAAYVRDMAERGIISGYRDADGQPLGAYGPADSVTIEQLAKIAVEAAAVDQSKCPAEPLNDKALHRWSQTYISCAEYLRWSIFSEGIVQLDRPATRTEVVVTVLQAFSREFEAATGKVFQDVSNTLVFRNAIETAALDGIVSGYSDEQGNPTGYFGPFDDVNRAETAKIVSLAIQLYGF